MKKIALIILFFGLNANAQVSKTISVAGKIAKPFTINFADLKNYASQSIDSLVILNHKQEYKSTLKKLKGVLLKEVLSKAEFTVNSPKVLSEFYIVCVADDGYKVVFSWNEIFNSPTGDKALILTEINGNSTITQKEGIILVTPIDKATGRRYVKNLSKITIHQVQ
ncbi:molybdopterin-binding protein [Flavobacterium qiangtangense]|uniref:Molybdopterin-binding protein n=1 Tax=Flavobacterium qiangtangense TaxID=1442595 RepID=A0ABW1PJI5_9FLAO